MTHSILECLSIATAREVEGVMSRVGPEYSFALFVFQEHRQAYEFRMTADIPLEVAIATLEQVIENLKAGDIEACLEVHIRPVAN